MSEQARPVPVPPRNPAPPPAPTRAHAHVMHVDTLDNLSVPYESSPALLTDLPACNEPLMVMDGGREIRFTGSLIAFASSERPFAPRFTEFRLYRTSKAMYVVSRVGISRVFHDSECPQAHSHRLPYGNDLTTIPPIIQMSPCTICKPSRTTDPRGLRFERERPWAGVADNAKGVVQLLTQNATHGSVSSGRSISQLGSRLLTDASRIDSDIRSAYLVTEL